LNGDVVRVAAVGDLHCGKASQGAFQPLFTRMAEAADVVAVCGDLTDYGLPEEARVLAREVSVLKLPIVAVFGNHDYESGHAEEVCSILTDPGHGGHRAGGDPALSGLSRLEDPINRYSATLVVHGHAHHGAPEGRTTTGVPVYNVSIPVLRAAFPEQPTFRMFEIPVTSEVAVPAAAGS
jgi:Icc-related predicted phosphoesterase